MVAVSLSPQDLIDNIRHTVEFLGFGTPPWFVAATLSVPVRSAVFAAGAAIITLGLWPERKIGRGAPLDRPASDWTALISAPFWFARHPAAQNIGNSLPPRFMSTFLSLGVRGAARPGLPEKGFDPGVPRARNKYGHEMIYCGVQWDKETFVWRWRSDEERPRGSGYGISPWNLEKPDDGSALHFCTPETWSELRSKAKFVWSAMQDTLETAIAEGIVLVWARVGSPTSSFTCIPSDSWRHYTVTDPQSGRAESPGSPTLYSVHFVSSPQKRPVVDQASGLLLAVRRRIGGKAPPSSATSD